MRTRALLLLSLVISLATAVPTAWAADTPFVVITSPGVPQRHLSREAVAQIFLRKQDFWDSSARVHPVNLPASHALRRAFSQAMLGHLPEEFEDYWREMYFHGVLPPHVVASEEAVILFVASTPGAIGYVSGCYPDHRVNVVLVVGELPHCAK
ncbi:hypothetical protein BH11PSE7_BH11PSE7_21260 [soil metagenome]